MVSFTLLGKIVVSIFIVCEWGVGVCVCMFLYIFSRGTVKCFWLGDRLIHYEIC